jgi:hypothetical protein
MMQDDKKLSDLLNTYAVQQPAKGFDSTVMHRITATKPAAPLMNTSLTKFLFGLFIIIVVVALLTAFYIQPQLLPVRFTMPVSADVYRHLFSFFIAFWMVMGVNLWWQKRKSFRQSVTID